MLNVVVTGELDSGKSTLIGRLLYDTHSISYGAIEEVKKISRDLERDFEFAYLLDSFEEERKNQLTIDTTQAYCKAKNGKGLIFIDVPGHEELLKNMLSGSSYADIAILVIDAQKSLEEQTRRHAFILKFLGIEQVIMVLNKMDLNGFNQDAFKEIKERLSGFLNKIGIHPQHCIPVAARQGENLIKRSKEMPWYRGLTLIKALTLCVEKRYDGDFRMPIQDIYNYNREKIAVGKIISGKIKKGEKVKILPLNQDCRIKRIRVFNKDRTVATTPESVGLVLDDMSGLRRGQIVCKATLPKVNTEILAKIFCVHPLTVKEELKFKCVTQEVAATIKQINKVWDSGSLEQKRQEAKLDKNDVAEVAIVAKDPVVIEKFKGFNNLGRFVLEGRDKDICALGIIP